MLFQGVDEGFPRIVSKGIVYEGDAKIFGWKGDLREAKNASYMGLISMRVLKNKIWDLSIFIEILEALFKSLRMLHILRDSLVVGLPIIMVSSTNFL
jgi:hypothetical protein